VFLLIQRKVGLSFVSIEVGSLKTTSFYLGYCVVYSVIGFVSEKMNFWFWHFCKKVMIAHFGCCAKEP